MNTCFFERDGKIDDVYQLCTCGKHIWSSKKKCIIKVDKNNVVRITQNGERIKYVVDIDHRGKRCGFFTFTLFVFLCFMMIIVIL